MKEWMTADNSRQRFNLATMSGVFPGTRTQVYQRVRLQPLWQQTSGPIWAQVLWYREPRSCLVFCQNEAGEWASEPVVRVEAEADRMHLALTAALAEQGWQLAGCGTCRWWQPSNATTPDGLAAGLCQVAEATPLALQSSLALSCPHWEPAPAGNAEVAPVQVDPVAPLDKIAEVSESKVWGWAHVWRLILRWLRLARSPQQRQTLAERSGVGAGTEPCFACQGRIANLGALAVETADSDTQTYSIWRCRSCFTTYLNDWIDRWVRLDSLETEERYYRLAPAEAQALLHVLDGVEGGEHPAGRRQRTAQQAQFLQFLAQRSPLSHQIRQGR